MSRWRAALLAGLLVGGLQTAALRVQGAAAAIVHRSPFGLSIEYPLMEKALGSGPCPGHALVAALRALGSPSLRIGGDSQDLAGPTAAYHYPIPASFWTRLGCLARETGVRVIVGVNLAEGPVVDEQTTIAAAEQAIPTSQLSFSLGNEPDLYGISHILPNEPGFVVPAYRPSWWSAGAYASEWASRRTLLGRVPIEGPDLAGIGWRVRVARLLAADPPDAMTVHAYPTVACGSAGAPTTAARLLSEHASVGLVEKYDWLLTAARAARRPAIISESNSASCGGKPGVSDTPVAGIWAVRYVVAALLAGFEQVRFHTAGTSYDPLAFEANGTVAMRPLGHALLFLHRWVPLGSRIESPVPGRGSPRDPRILAATVSQGAHESMIVSSFSRKPISFVIRVREVSGRLRTDTLTRVSATEARGSVTVRAHRARIVLAPDTVLAIRTG
ncbi:MAG TPA: hypothetical protein VFV03_07715 [Solirubrobacteraceae bacterium]|nr:hypothetical protein [Solirubrobacteraceae bacterium]